MKILLTTAIIVSALYATSQADVLTLLPVADSTVDALAPDTEFSTGNLEAAMTGTNGAPATFLKFLFAQYQLPDGMTGQDIASINSVDFRVRRSSEMTPKLNLTYYVYAVHDGIDSESANTYTWNDSVGFDETHNEVRFLTVDEISYYSDPGESAYIGNLDTSSSGPTTRPFGFTADIFQGETALQNRRDAILQDTDGRITLYMRVRAPFEVTPLQMFASLENTEGILAPQLVIDFVPGAAGVPGDFNNDGTVDTADYVVFRKNENTNNALPNDNGLGTPIGPAHYDLFRTNFGDSSGAGAQAAIPEPSSITLLLMIGVPAACSMRCFQTRARRSDGRSTLFWNR